MSVKLRLKRMGRRNHPSYRIVAADSKSPRDGRFIESLGHYDPHTDPATVRVDEEKVKMWLEKGAEPSETVKSILSQLGFYKKWHEAEIIDRKRQSALDEKAKISSGGEEAQAG